MTYNFIKPQEDIIGGKYKAAYNFTKSQESNILEKWGLDFYRILHFTIKGLAKQW